MDPVNGPLFTCLSCSIAFASAEDQTLLSSTKKCSREDRKPLSYPLLEDPVVKCAGKAPNIHILKTYTTENAYRSHINSKKHKENEVKAASQLRNAQSHHVVNDDFYEPPLNPPQPPPPELQVPLGEIAETKIAVGNVCIYCNGKGRELRTLEAVRKHMIDKGHCKIAYDTESDKLEVSDYYDFTTSYPTEASRRKKETKLADDEDWEDVEDDSCSSEDLDEVDDPSASESDDSESLPDNQLTYGDTEYELVLPSGARIGHRSMKRYYSPVAP
ncbi:hypothetical protein BU15DRAFT_58610 [Melanogaster broomeanus]|nr:hypothetical protein BU15DRAFT_58610 [Melanogaster broomeanus]